ncbi:MAG: hypothetical protein EZS28_026181, partial [Streblomastix strix]
ASIVKSGADDSVVLLGAGGTKPISEFSSSVDDSKYVKNDGDVQDIQGILRKTTLNQPYPEPTDDDYITLGAVKSEFISSIYSGSISGNLTSTSFIKSDKDDTSVLLAGGGDRLLSDFSSGGATVEILSNEVAKNEIATIFNYSSLAFAKLDNLYLFQLQAAPKQEGFAPSMNIKIGTLPTQYAPTVSELYTPVGGPYGGFKPHITNTGEIRCYSVGVFYFDERLLDAAGLSDFSELYTYIKERYPKLLVQQPQPVPIGDQTLQQQVKNNDDIIYGSRDLNDEFESPVPNAITKLDLSSQLEQQSFLASSGSDPQLIVYGERIALSASNATTGLFPGGGQCTNTNESAPEDVESHFDEVIIKHEKQLDSSSQPQYMITNVYNQVCVFNLYFESKALDRRTQEVGRIPDSLISADGKKPQESIPTDSDEVFKYCAGGIWPQLFIKVSDSMYSMHSSQLKMNRFLMKATHLQQAGTIEETLLGNAVVPFTNDGEHHFSIKEIKPEFQMPALFDNEIIISLSDTDHDITQIQNSFLSIAQTANIQFDDKFDKIDEQYKEGLVLFVGLKSACGTYISMREIEELIGNQTAVPYTIPIRFRVNIPLDYLLIFSAFTDYPNGLFGDLKIKFKINLHAFVFCQMNPIISMANYNTINKDELLSSSHQKLMDIDLMFRNWSLAFQYTKQFTQLGCTADLITGLHAEPPTESRLKNLEFDIKPVTMSIKNYVITQVTANMAGYKAIDACLNRVRQFQS